MERVAILVDGPNIGLGAKRRGLLVDFGQVLRWAKQGGPAVPGLAHERQIVKATVYIGPPSGGQESVARGKFLKMLRDLGYQVCVSFEEGNHRKTAVDRDIVIDALVFGLGGHMDTLILLSGDGGFTRLVRVLTSVGIQVIVCSFEDVSQALKNSASQFLDLGTCSTVWGPLTRVRGAETTMMMEAVGAVEDE